MAYIESNYNHIFVLARCIMFVDAQYKNIYYTKYIPRYIINNNSVRSKTKIEIPWLFRHLHFVEAY